MTVSVYADPGRAPVRTLTAAVVDGRWAASTSGLAPGTYTARASQVDAAGNEGLSAPREFSVGSPPAPTPTPTPTPTASPTPTATPTSEPTATPGAQPTAEPPAAVGPATPPPPATPLDDAPGLDAPAPVCTVPKLRGKSLRAVGASLRRSGCRIGRVARKRTRKGKRGRVVAQTPRAGVRRPSVPV